MTALGAKTYDPDGVMLAVGGVLTGTAQQLEDMVDNMVAAVPARAGMHFSDNVVATVIATQSVFVKAAGATELLVASSALTMPADNKLVYTGYEVYAQLSFHATVDSDGNNQVITVAIAKNGTPVVPSYMQTKLAAAHDVRAVSVRAGLLISDGDYFEVFVRNDTSAEDVTILHGCLDFISFPRA